MSEQLDQQQIEILEETFAKLADNGDKLVENFYSELFRRFPDVKPMFAHVDQKEQEKKLLSSLALVINNIRKPEVLGPALSSMGKKHQKYGAVAEHYPAVAETLLDVMGELAGDLWTDDVKRAWSNALNTVATAMLEAYEDSEDGPMSAEMDGDVNEIKKELDELKQQYKEQSGKLSAIDKVQAVIEFELDGTIITANENFLNTVGYSLQEIQGRHHSMFVDPGYAGSAEYKDFWRKLGQGEHQSGQYRRFDKNGKEIWLTASYNPVVDNSGKPIKIVKYATDGSELRKQQQAATRLQVAVDGAQSPMIMIDRDFIITYANETTVALLTKYEDKFKEVWPSFAVKNVMGTCIDVFHKNPAHQRKLLDDPKNLPYTTDIDINGLKFSLTVTAQMDLDGNYIGNTLEWQDVTELRIKENEQARLQVAVDGCQSPMIMIDRDFNITYANDATVELLTKYEDKFKEAWPTFDLKNVMGTCIDVFHKNPAHQRKLLDDPNNLPYKTDIEINGLKFSLTVSAQMDAEGNYIGNTLEWQDVTELRIKENEQARLQVAVDGCQSPMIMIDRDFNITYANDATVELLTKYEDKFKETWPSFSVDGVMGTCIDMFHKNPAHQRKLLDDPNNLPYKTDIEINGLKFSLTVSAQMDAEGNYIGNTLEWQDVTELRIKENEQARLQVAIDGCQSAMMMVDRDLIITYVNDATVELLAGHKETFQEAWPTVDLDKIIGTCIDVFHKNPAHQRKLLSDPKNLPYKTDIEIGDLKFALSVSAQMDAEGNYIGSTLEWMDVTDARAKEVLNNDYAGQIEAISKSQGVIEFNMDGTIRTANDNFLSVIDYSLDEIKGKHHRMFATPEYAKSVEYSQFWEKLNRGEYDTGEYKRFGKNGREIWIQASYNPIMDMNGKPFKVVKYAVDITDQKDAQLQIENLIESASKGELEHRIDSSKYSGDVKASADGINNLLDAVSEPMKAVTEVVEVLAEGGLNKQVTGEFEGQFAVLGDAVNTSIGNLLNMVNEIRTSADSINTSANEIAQGNLNLSQRTEEQASSLEETASSIEELTGTVKQNADNAQQANQLATGARTEAEKGGSVVGDAIKAMTEINQSSKKIADIIGVIDEIAFQTNLLALNAAVEAARAGEQGRGFAVVAAEVRNLAQRSAGAAKEIKTLINDSVTKVEEGSRLVDESGSTLEEIVTSVKKVSDIIAEIAAASSEQSSGIDQINKAVSQMDEMTQQNASLVEEAASASESMDEQAKGLTELMNFFNVGDNSAASNLQDTAERRGSERPWAEDKQAADSAPKQSAVKKVASPGSDSEWEEF